MSCVHPTNLISLYRGSHLADVRVAPGPLTFSLLRLATTSISVWVPDVLALFSSLGASSFDMYAHRFVSWLETESLGP